MTAYFAQGLNINLEILSWKRCGKGFRVIKKRKSPFITAEQTSLQIPRVIMDKMPFPQKRFPKKNKLKGIVYNGGKRT